MARIALFFHHCPFPPRAGCHQRLLQMLRGLRELGQEVTLISPANDTLYPWTEWQVETLQREYVAHVSLVPGKAIPERVRDWFAPIVRELDPDIIWVNYAQWAYWLAAETFGPPTVLDTYDLIARNQVYQEHVQSLMTRDDNEVWQPASPALFDNFVPREPDPKQLGWELDIHQRFTAVITISPEEHQLLQEIDPDLPTHYIPFSPEFPSEGLPALSGPPVFVAADNVFNVQAYYFLRDRVIPQLLPFLPAVKIHVIGNLGKRVKSAPWFKMTDSIPDLGDIYRTAAFSLCPLLSGTGQKIKVLEAMARGVPVLSMQQPAQSCGLQPEFSRVASTAAEFSEHFRELWSNRSLCRELGEAGREFAKREFGWPKFLNELQRMLESLSWPGS